MTPSLFQGTAGHLLSPFITARGVCSLFTILQELCFRWPAAPRLTQKSRTRPNKPNHLCAANLSDCICLKLHCYSATPPSPPPTLAKVALSCVVTQTQSSTYLTLLIKCQLDRFVFPVLLLCSQLRIYTLSMFASAHWNLYFIIYIYIYLYIYL